MTLQVLSLLAALIAAPGDPVSEPPAVPPPGTRFAPVPPPTPAPPRSRPSPARRPDRIAALSGLRVWISLDFGVVRGRMWLLAGDQLLVQLASGDVRVIARREVRRIGLLSGPEQTDGAGKRGGRSKAASHFHPTWIGLRGHLGSGLTYVNAGLELTLLQLRYKSFFYDVLHVGVSFPIVGYAGFAIGGVVKLSPDYRRALLLGAHFTWPVGPTVFFGEGPSVIPVASGVLVEYRYAYASGMDLSVGVRSQYLSAVITVGVGY